GPWPAGRPASPPPGRPCAPRRAAPVMPRGTPRWPTWRRSAMAEPNETAAYVPVPDGTVRIYIDVAIDSGTDCGDVADDISDAIANRPGRGGFSVAQIVVPPEEIQ